LVYSFIHNPLQSHTPPHHTLAPGSASTAIRRLGCLTNDHFTLLRRCLPRPHYHVIIKVVMRRISPGPYLLTLLINHRVTNLRPDDSEGNPFWYTFKVQCTSCRETHSKPVAVSRFVRFNFF